jgi:hypothetical protein
LFNPGLLCLENFYAEGGGGASVDLGDRVNAATVSRAAQQLDEAVEAFHRCRLKDAYWVLISDGVLMKRKTWAGAV